MSILSQYPEERDAFFRELELLINRYPMLTTNKDFPCDNPDHKRPDPDVPKTINGIVIVISTNTMDDWEEMHYETPIGQSVFHTGGMIEAVRRNML